MIPYFDIPTTLFPISAFTQSVVAISVPNIPSSTEAEVFADAPKSLDVPFYSQLQDIKSPDWKKRACGVASLAMLIEYYKPGTVSVNALLEQAIDSGAYLKNAGWIHRDLALLAKKYDLKGKNYDLSGTNKDIAFDQLKDHLKDGPVMVSVYYKFDPKSTIPHLVVINNIEGDTVYYNDPAEKECGNNISTAKFLKAWKKRFIVVRPTQDTEKLAIK